MKLRLRTLVTLSVLLGACAFIACGAEPTPPPPPPPQPAAKAEPEPEPEPEEADAGADAAAAAPAPQQSSGRTPVLKSDDEEISDTFGSSPPAKLELGDDSGRAVLRIPENALSEGINLTFKIDKKGKSTGAPVGKIYRMWAHIPPSSEPREMTSAGPVFELAMPAGAKKEANLAIGRIVVDDKGREKIEWTILAPKKIDDSTNMAHFELNSLPNAFLHVTTKAPTEPKP